MLWTWLKPARSGQCSQASSWLWGLTSLFSASMRLRYSSDCTLETWKTWNLCHPPLLIHVETIPLRVQIHRCVTAWLAGASSGLMTVPPGLGCQLPSARDSFFPRQAWVKTHSAGCQVCSVNTQGFWGRGLITLHCTALHCTALCTLHSALCTLHPASVSPPWAEDWGESQKALGVIEEAGEGCVSNSCEFGGEAPISISPRPRAWAR